MTPRPLSFVLGVAVTVLAALPAAAQYTQYTEPGEANIPELPTKERFERVMSEARWRLGKVRVEPWIGIRDAGYIDNVFGTSTDTPQSDVTVTGGFGLHAYTYFSPKLVFAAHALPEYVWWRELEDRRVWNGRYGAGIFGFLNRLRFQVTATTGRQTQYLSSELEQPVNVNRDRGAASLELKLSGHISLAAGASSNQWRYRDRDITGPAGDQLLQLDRDETRLRGGLRYYIDRGFHIGVGFEDTTVDFTRAGNDRSSKGTSPSVELTYLSSHLNAYAEVIFANLEPAPGSSFIAFDDPLGFFVLRWQPRGKLQLSLYGRGNLVYSLSGYPYYSDRRLGLAADMPFGSRASGRVFLEEGKNLYPKTAELDAFADDVQAYGLDFRMTLYRKLNFRGGVRRTDYSSFESGRARSIDRITVGLSLGESTSEWW